MNVIEAEDIIRVHHLPRHFLPPEFNLLTTEVVRPNSNGPANVEKLPELRAGEGGGPKIENLQTKAMPESLLGLQKTREKELINLALTESAGNVSRAARKLNISRQLLHYKMKKYSLKRERYCAS